MSHPSVLLVTHTSSIKVYDRGYHGNTEFGSAKWVDSTEMQEKRFPYSRMFGFFWVDYVSGATQSANAFYYAVTDALSKAVPNQ